MAKSCPICAKPADEKYTPFCSKRCADIDLGRWLNGSYVVPGSEDSTIPQDASIVPGEDEI